MASYVLMHGAGSSAWYWHLISPELRALGHDVVAPDLPCDDDSAGLREYVDVVIDALGGHAGDEVVVVGQSLAGFTAPLVCERIPVALLVLLNAMVPRPNETAGQWWTNTGHVFPEPFDELTVFLHDVPADVTSKAADHVRRQSDTIFTQPWPLPAWPAVPTRYLLSVDDRLFPANFQRRVVRERLGISPDEMPGGHLPALAQPRELIARLERYRIEVQGKRTG